MLFPSGMVEQLTEHTEAFFNLCNQCFIAVLNDTHRWILFRASLIQFTSAYHIYLNYLNSE
jgi:hypothetical protein